MICFLNINQIPVVSLCHMLTVGQNSEGDYNRPVRTRDAFGADLAPGVYQAPAAWDKDLGIRYNVQDGAIWNQDYQFHGGQH